MRPSLLRSYLVRRLRARAFGVPLSPLALGRTADFVNSRLTTLVIAGRKVAIRIPDEVGVKHAIMEVLLEDVYGLRRLKSAPRTIADIGANVGLFCLAARNLFPQAIIHSYEPNPAVRPYLETQAWCVGAQPYFEAVQLESGRVSLQSSRESVGFRTAVDHRGDTPAVAFRTVLDRLGDSVDFVKLDCEGAEWEILTDRDAWRRVRHAAIEYHGDEERDAGTALGLVSGLGFQILRHHRGPGRNGVIHAGRR